MRLLSKKGEKEQNSKQQPVLTLKVNVLQTRNVDLFEKFHCKPVCFVTTNYYVTQRTRTLGGSSASWNQVVDLRLPKKPKSNRVRIIVYDVVPMHDSLVDNGNHSANMATRSALSLPSLHRRSNSVSTTSVNNINGGSSYNNNYNTKLNSSLPNSPTEMTTSSLRNIYNNNYYTKSFSSLDHHHNNTTTFTTDNINNNNTDTSITITTSSSSSSINNNNNNNNNKQTFSTAHLHATNSTHYNAYNNIHNLPFNTFSSSNANSTTNINYTSECNNNIYCNNNNNIYYNDYSSNANSNNKKKEKFKYMYIGEVQLSIIDLFKKNESNTQYNFNQLNSPQWYTLYDKRRELQHYYSSNEKMSFNVGEIQLSFALTSNKKRNFSTLQAFINWQQQLSKYLMTKNHQKLIKSNHHNKNNITSNNNNTNFRSDQPNSYPVSTESLEDNNNQDQFNDNDDDENIHMEMYEDEDEDEDEEFEPLSKYISPIPSDISMLTTTTTSSSNISTTTTTSDDENEADNDALYANEIEAVATDENVNIMDLNSLVNALDEYDVVDGTISNSNDNINNSTDNVIDDLATDFHHIKTEMSNEKLSAISSSSPDQSDANDINISQSRRSSFSNLENTYGEDSDTSSDTEDEERNQSLQFKPNGSKLLRLRRKRKSIYSKQKYNEIIESKSNFKVSKKQHSLGVIFLELKNITNLPILKNKLSRRNYDMDPFIIITFGRRVFKSSWRKHTLNPEFNEYLAFEIFPNETNFSFHFKVMDKDSFSFNDEIAEYNLPWFDIIQNIKQSDAKSADMWHDFSLSLNLNLKTDSVENPILNIRIKYSPYPILKGNFWKYAVDNHVTKENFDIIDLLLFLDNVGSFSDRDALDFFSRFDKLAWAGQRISRQDLINGLKTWRRTSEFKNVWRCPKCFQDRKKTSKRNSKSKLTNENDLITHFAICCFERQFKVLKPDYASSAFASKRWFSKVLIKLSYGKYALGSNNANILVQDRDTGIVIEEKISAHVKVGMRIIYNGKGKESKKFRHLLKTLSIRQGKKFDSPLSVKQIGSFIKFHSLDVSECVPTEYNSFNEFFFRKLKDGSRLIEGKSSPKIIVSPADSRSTFFSSIDKSKEIWIKASKFTINKLTDNYEIDKFNNTNTSIAIFRLAPQDYHRFHSPCDVIIGKPHYIDGEYYTVNPMAIRSELDVFGENVRVVIPMISEEFGKFLFIAVGAMMVGSIILTCKEGDRIAKGEEVGYFKFGGSTIILVFPKDNIEFDSDLLNNSTEQIETLVKVGMSIGHTPDIKQLTRKRKTVTSPVQLEKIKRTISVTDDKIKVFDNSSWEYHTLSNMLEDDYGSSEISLSKEENNHLNN